MNILHQRYGHAVQYSESNAFLDCIFQYTNRYFTLKSGVTEKSIILNQSARRNIPQDLYLQPAVVKTSNLEHYKQCIIEINLVPCEYSKATQ